MTNLLTAPWSGPFCLPPFRKIEDTDFGPAFDEALAQARANIARIATDPSAPNFANVIEPLEQAEDLLDRVGGLFFNLASADSTDARETLQRDLAPLLSDFSSEVVNNKMLFARIEALVLQGDRLDLTPEQVRVLALYQRMFIRSGARLPGGKGPAHD